MNISDIEIAVRISAPAFVSHIQAAAAASHNEAEFRTRINRFIEDFADQIGLTIPLREEYTLINGQADAVYNRLIIEYEAPGTL